MTPAAQSTADTLPPLGHAVAKEFEAFALVKAVPVAEKAPGDERWLVYGESALVGETDYDGDILDAEDVEKGLETWVRFGMPVDWEHLYSRTKDPRTLIGKGVEIRRNAGRAPTVIAELFPAKDLARAAWEHLTAGGQLGYSIQGSAVAVPGELTKAGAPRLRMRIHMMTLSPVAKGFEGPVVRVGMPPDEIPTLTTVMKALTAEIAAGATEGWVEVQDFTRPVAEAPAPAADTLTPGPSPELPSTPNARARAIAPDGGEKTEKALEVGNEPVQPGETGGAALRTQALIGGKRAKPSCSCGSKDGCRCPDRTGGMCPHCGAMHERGDDGKCNRCGKPWPERPRRKRAAALTKALTLHGVRNPAATARAISGLLSDKRTSRV